VRVLIVDDDPLFRLGVAAALAADDSSSSSARRETAKLPSP
jgi:DNA-binding NarL/FixJ family response regulator